MSMYENEQVMQHLDQHLGIDADGLDESGTQLWDELQAPEAIEELSEDERIESGAQRWQESQADQNYWAQCAAEGYNPGEHDRNCDCRDCVGDEPDEYDPRREEF